ncbi:MAG: DUF2339 domain-containing protein [Ideonella sp.]|nr:DUF2339 domain-containing protein [Ideonella sp.]MCC7458560.1 DUF2339 domain-containing protein [Nitrospira sp.]
MLMLLAIAVGVIVGAGLGDGEFGAVVGGVLGWLVLRSVRQQGAIEELRGRLAKQPSAVPQAALAVADETATPAAVAVPPGAAVPPMRKGATATLEGYRPPPTPAPERAAGAAMASTEAAADQPDTQPMPLDPPGTLLSREAAAAAPAAARATAQAPASSDALAALQRWLFGGNTIVKLGVGILFIGLAFLAKFASEHVQVPVELRLMGIAAVALVLLVVGWRLRDARAGYAQALQGGAVAVLYLTLFVAFRYYGVLSALPVFALMVVVAALAAALAVLQDAKALAVIGALGGFATPLLVSTGSGNHVALFSYYLVLDLGIAAVAWHRTWRSLNLIGFLGTFAVATAWGVLRYDPQQYASSQAFLIAFFVLFAAIMLMPARRGDTARVAAAGADWPPQAWVHGSLLFGLPTITFVLQYGLVRDTEYGVAISALVLAAFYVLLARSLRARPELRLAFEGCLAVATVFLTLVIPFALDARSTAGAWALEGAGLVWLGLRQRRALARAFGYALIGLAGLALVYAHDLHGTPTQLLNALFFNGLLVAAAALVAARAVQRTEAAPTAGTPSLGAEALVQPLLIAWGTLWLLGAAAVQIDAFVPLRQAWAAWLATFSAIALLYALLSVRLRWPQVALPAIAHAPLHALGVGWAAVFLARPMQDGGWWAWPLAALAHAVALRWLAPHWPAAVRHAVHAIGALVLAALGALQGRVFTADWGDAGSAWPWLGWLVVPALMLLALPRAGVAPRWPVRELPAAYQGTVGAVLSVGLLLWTLLANVASNGSAQPLPHVPLLNPLDLGVAVALAGVWLWQRSAAARALVGERGGLLQVLLVFAAFVWLNAMLIRGFHHYGGVPYRVDAWLHSLAVQTGIALLWTALALVVMWVSARRALRTPWLAGAVLLGAVVLKLLLIDQSGTGTITRIVSFIGVGVLMLVIGYVAPLPARREESAHVAP